MYYDFNILNGRGLNHSLKYDQKLLPRTGCSDPSKDCQFCTFSRAAQRL